MPLLRRPREAQVPEQHLPVQRPALGPEGRVEHPPVGAEARLGERLEVMAGDQLVLHGRPREVAVVAAQAHLLLRVLHRARREGDDQDLAAEEERVDLLPLGRHHLHAPASRRPAAGPSPGRAPRRTGWPRAPGRGPAPAARRAGRASSLTRSRAARQSSPSPMSRAARRISSRHQSRSCRAMSINSSGVSGMRLCARSSSERLAAHGVADDGRPRPPAPAISRRRNAAYPVSVSSSARYGSLGPPGEERVVAVVMAEPLLQHPAEPLHRLRRAVGHRRPIRRRFLAPRVELMPAGHAARGPGPGGLQSLRRRRGIDRLQCPPLLFQGDQIGRKGQQPTHLRE